MRRRLLDHGAAAAAAAATLADAYDIEPVPTNGPASDAVVLIDDHTPSASGEDLRRRAGAIDSALLDLFIEARVFDSASSVSRSVTQTASTAGANA